MTEAAKLLQTVQKFTDKASISDKADTLGVQTNVIEIPCLVAGNPIALRVAVESHDFQIFLGDWLSLDKVEGTEIVAKDVEGFVISLLTAIKEGKAQVFEHSFLGKKVYSLDTADSNGHTPYETLTQVLVKRLGKKRALGNVEFDI